MSAVRVLVGRRKGAFALTSDGTRRRWDVSAPHFGGWEEALPQCYTRRGDRLYVYESRGGDFRAELAVDDPGIVTRYEGIWEAAALPEPRC